MSFDRRITPVRADLADERLRGQVEAERYTAGVVKRVVASFTPLHRHPSREAPVDTQATFDTLLKYEYSAAINWDRVHPNHVGHMALARAFVNALGFRWS